MRNPRLTICIYKNHTMSKIRPFKSDLVIDDRISEPFLRTYHVVFDQKQFSLQPLVNINRKVIPESSLGYYCGINK